MMPLTSNVARRMFFTPLLLAGCVSLPELREEILPAGAFIEPLKKREAEIASLKALAEVRIQVRGREQRLLEAALLVPPSRLRLEALGLLGTALVLATDGERLYAHSLLSKEFVTAKATAEHLFALTGIRIPPPYLIRTLTGLPPLFAKAETLAFLPGAGEYRMETQEGLFLQKLWLKDRPFIDRGELYWADELVLRFRFEDMRSVNGVVFPHRIAFEQPEEGLHVEVRYLTLELNASIPPASFDLPFPQDGETRIIELKD